VLLITIVVGLLLNMMVCL